MATSHLENLTWYCPEMYFKCLIKFAWERNHLWYINGPGSSIPTRILALPIRIVDSLVIKYFTPYAIEHKMQGIEFAKVSTVFYYIL